MSEDHQNLIKGIVIVVLTKDIKSGRVIGEERLQWDSPEDRRWLGRLTYRNLTRGCSTETINEKDYTIKD